MTTRSNSIASPTLDWLDNPEVFAVNRLPAHSDHSFFVCSEGRKMRPLQSLDGTWRFLWGKQPSAVPGNFYETGFDLEENGFSRIEVPGSMEMQGYDRIHYTNSRYPWEGHHVLRPPMTDHEFNPVGLYVRDIRIDEALQNQKLFISFQGVEQAFYLWVEGQFIGYAEDSFTPSEFDITEAAAGKEVIRIAVRVHKRSSAAWIEDQDFFRFSGIFRSVYLYAKPDAHLEDFFAHPSLADDYKTGTLSIEAALSLDPRLQGKQARLRFMLSDAGQEVLSGEETAEISGDSMELRFLEQKIADVKQWSAKEPQLYDLLFELFIDGEKIEEVPYRIGFKRVEIRDAVIYMNGKRLKIFGVNRHEWNPSRGRAITEADMHQDIGIFLRNNINAVRTCHYPDQSLWYHLCDENGIMVCDETNMESHGSWQKYLGVVDPSWNVPGSLPEWKACVLDRAASMLERDKNHASIIFWSCGNESYAGEDILAMADFFRERDASRIVHYESCFYNRAFDRCSDVESRMYATPEEIDEYMKSDGVGGIKKPYVLCEYMHDLGNSIGGMESYMRLMDQYEGFAGGFIWDYIDQAVYMDWNGQKVLGYGGDFDDRPSDYNFSANGIVFADRTEKPCMQEVRYWYSDEAKAAFDAENARLAEKAAREDARNFVIPGKPELKRVEEGDFSFGVKTKNHNFIFAYDMGGLVSLSAYGKEWIHRAVKPAFWRGSTENDIGNGFTSQSSIWYATDRFIRHKDIQILSREGTAKIKYVYETQTTPATEVEVVYEVFTEGRMDVEVIYHGKEGLPELPCFGLRFVLPQKEAKVVWQGLSGETYPDRWKGGKFGIHEEEIAPPKYLVPQEYGCHVQTDWAKIVSKDGKHSLTIVPKDGEKLMFSATPYLPGELENAEHGFELPRPNRTVLTVYAAMRGVGGIDSWMTDVEEAYRVSAEKDMALRFTLFAN